MKKNFRILLVALFAVLGFTNAWAALPAEIEYGGCTYTVTDQDATAKTAKVTLKSGVTVSAGAIQLPGNFNYTMGSDTYKVSVTQIDPVTLPLKNLSDAVSVIIPKEIEAIPENCFYGCTYLKTITFEAGSAVKSIGTHAFATTQISEFDFSPCKSLAELPNEVFVETGLTNTFITKVTVPSGDDAALFKHINGAFKNLTKLTTIEGLDNSWIQEVIAFAFDGCTELKTLSLPGKGLRYIDEKALAGSVIKTLSINVSSLLSLGGGTVGAAPGYAWTVDATPAYNLYGQTEVNKTPLESLTLTGTLKGAIAYDAFAFCDKLDAVLDFKGMTFGSTGTIQENAFNTCYYTNGTTITRGIQGVKISDITDNTSGGFTIAANAFKGCQLLATVEIGDITTASAVGAKAFGEYLKDVTIGTVKASAAAFAAQAFVWKKIDNASLKLATGEGDYLNSNDASTTIIVAQTFDMSAITGLDAGKKYPTIQIGEIRSKGGVFAEKAITVPAALEALSFGAIADNGLNVKIFSDDTNVTTIDFNGAIGMHGIKGNAFGNLTKVTTLNFTGLLAESAVDPNSFNITNGAGTEKLNYTVASIPDYTVNPFAKNAFTQDASVDKDTERFIELNSNLFAALKANYEDATVGLKTDGKFEIYLVKFATTTPTETISFTLYRNDNATSEAWGRYDLGSFAKENKDGAYTQTTMIIPRVQKIKQSDDTEVTAKLTLYGIYTDEDDVNKEATIYMVPLHVINGKYEITKYNAKLIIAKAAISGSFVDKEIEWGYDNATAPTKNSVWTTIPGYAFAKQTAADNVTNQQLWDKTKNLYALFGSCAPDGATARADIWGTYTKKPMYDLYIMSNPAKNKGFRVDKNVVAKGGAYIAPTWYFALLKNYGDDAAPARVVWLDDSQATAIFGVKEVKTAESNDDAIYTLQGVRVSAPVKGQLYIQNGKKFIAK